MLGRLVYSARTIDGILQQKFHIPNDTNYTEDAYLQSASELSVANYVKRKLVSEFDTEKRVNPKNKLRLKDALLSAHQKFHFVFGVRRLLQDERMAWKSVGTGRIVYE
jgi:hypothetical protein